jgi:hypothetical protein
MPRTHLMEARAMRSIRTLERRFPAWGALATSGLLALALGLACGGEESSTPTAEQAPAKIEIPQVEMEEPVHAEVQQGNLPADYPKDLPIFPGAEPTTSMLVPGGTGMVVFSASSPAKEVAAFYTKALPEQGWTVEGTSHDGKRIQAAKDQRSATVAIEDGADGVEIAVLLGGA